MPSEAFEPAIPSLEQLHTNAIDRASTGIGSNNGLQPFFFATTAIFAFSRMLAGRSVPTL
jgi:hypothetical protein